MKRSLIKLFSVQNIIALGAIVFAIIFWFYKIDGIPKKVENHEARITSLEKDNIEIKTKLDLALAGIYEIRAVLLKQNIK